MKYRLAKRLFGNAGIPSNFHMKDPENGQGGGGGGGGGEADGNEAGGEKAPEANAGDGKTDDKSGDDKSKITDEAAKLLKETMSWKTKAKDKETEATQAKTALEQLQAALGGLSVEDVQKVINDKKAADTKALEDKGEYTRLIERMRTEHTTELTGKDSALVESRKENATLKAQIEELTVGRAFSDSKFVRENSTLPASIARREFGAHFDVQPNGTVVGFDKPRTASDRTMIIDGQGNPKSFDDAIAELFAGHPDAENISRSKAKQGSETKMTVEIKDDVKTVASPLEKITAGLKAGASKS